MLIDPGHIVNELGEPCSERLINSMAGDDIKIEDIGLIINTHCHPDHCEANQIFVDRSKPKQALITFHKEEEEWRERYKMLGGQMDFEPNFYLREGELSIGKEHKLKLQILHTPGHSPGSISIYWPGSKALICGDVLFYAAVGRTDIPGGDGKLLKRSIERLSQLDIEYLLPGHSTEFGDIIRDKDKVEQNFAFIRLNYFPLL